jgi:hypothetical protein
MTDQPAVKKAKTGACTIGNARLSWDQMRTILESKRDVLNSISPRSFGARIVRSTAAAAAQLQLLWPDAVRTAVRRSTRRISRQQQT